MGQYLLKAPDADLDAWKKAAEKDGTSFAHWLRHAAESYLRDSKEQKTSVRVVVPKTQTTSGECAVKWKHRSGVFCKYCGKIA